MSQENKPVKTYRETFTPQVGQGKEKIVEALSTVDPVNLHARTRIGAVFSMAVHSTLAAFTRREKTFTNLQNVKFQMRSVAGVMGHFQFEYEALAISGDGGEGRKEVTKVLSLAAIGGTDDTGVIAANVLNEGSKQLGGKAAAKT